MNYDILTDKQLLEKLIERRIPFAVNKINRKKILKLLKDYDLNKAKRELFESLKEDDLNKPKEELSESLKEDDLNKPKKELLESLKEDDLKDPSKKYNDFEKYNPKNTFFTKKKEISDLGKAGAIINIIASVFLSFFIITLIITVPAIIFNSLFPKYKKFKITSGILGLFCSIVGGIFVLVGQIYYV